jgi:hypothetical protein
VLLVHNSRPNTSGRPRRIMIYSHYPDRVDMGQDVRNGPTRVREQPYEQQYRELVERGEFTPVSLAAEGRDAGSRYGSSRSRGSRLS